ncbi:insulinase family protein [Glaciecola sp. MH2013]|uniref:M16 family metallopeptidase n=1 Tax=Glaciecola sp. MH2013 TaxID=2785524 RepID=UPI00189E230C|nr:pitrilysin family protein [Glaciecola sp. MH2013]MBF7073882.1 insulinase family protein [Glaciecola sp. MH2013]
MKKILSALAISMLSLCFISACSTGDTEDGFTVDYVQYELDNGLKVILHQDSSDPIVAMATVVHVGSNREKPGRTGFAHFFEHMSFNDSENVPKGANRKMIPELGGTRNGGTWSDGTIYYEVVPKDAFDKLLWIDSDRLGYMINTVDQGTLEREKQVVKNEKRQRVDNRAYGHTGHVIKKSLYPSSHPYNWTVIGDLEDLQAATLADVKEFYDTYYVPSNATLVIAGDIDIEETKQKVERWFGEIKAGKPVEPMKPMPVTLKESKKLYHIDNFAKLPEIRLTFPTVEQYHEDAYALDALGSLLSSGKNSALYKVIVEQNKQAPGVSSYHRAEEIAGTFTVRVRANSGVKLDDVYKAILSALDTFAVEGFTDDQLTKIKAQSETSFYYAIESILDKALQLGIYNEYAGSPDFIKQDIANITAVSREDIMRVFEKYVHNKPAIITSFVPKGGIDLIVSDSLKAPVVEEEIKQNAEQKFVENDEVVFEKTETKHDRSEPPLTELPALSIPLVWESSTANGMRVLGIEQTELPLVNFSITIEGGQAFDKPDKLGTAFLMAQLMNEGTANKTPQQLEEAIGLLGASLRISSGKESVVIRGNALAKNFEATLALVNEMIMQPRWDKAEFERLKSRRLTSIQQSKGNANSIASQAFLKQLYGEEHLGGQATGGKAATVAAITLDDLKAYYKNYLTPKNASFHIVGDVKQSQVEKGLSQLSAWQGEKIALPTQPSITNVKKPKLYFIDLPNAKQSVIYVGKASVAGDDKYFYPIQFANMRLGGGISARLAQTLRIEKGYTYGAYSYLPATGYQSPFIASSQVRTNVTLESLEVFKDLIGNYRATFTEEDLSVARNMTIKSNARRFETLNSLLRMLETISSFDKDKNYIEQEQNFVMNAKLVDMHNAIDSFLAEQEMIYLVVGDAATQLSRMESLGYGKPILLDTDGNKL